MYDPSSPDTRGGGDAPFAQTKSSQRVKHESHCGQNKRHGWPLLALLGTLRLLDP
jgi:hypothetical protein